RAGSMLMRLTRVRTPSVRASPTAGKPVRLGFTPPARLSVARRIAPMQAPPAHTSPTVAALPSLQDKPLFRFSQPTVGGVQRSVVHTFRSSQLRAAPTQVPVRVQVSATVQAFPSLQAAPGVKPAAAHAPAPLQAKFVQTAVPVQGELAGSNLQVG